MADLDITYEQQCVKVSVSMPLKLLNTAREIHPEVKLSHLIQMALNEWVRNHREDSNWMEAGRLLMEARRGDSYNLSPAAAPKVHTADDGTTF